MQTLAIRIPDFTPDEYARFDANDRAAVEAAHAAEATCAGAGPFPTSGCAGRDIELGELPF